MRGPATRGSAEFPACIHEPVDEAPENPGHNHGLAARTRTTKTRLTSAVSVLEVFRTTRILGVRYEEHHDQGPGPHVGLGACGPRARSRLRRRQGNSTASRLRTRPHRLELAQVVARGRSASLGKGYRRRDLGCWSLRALARVFRGARPGARRANGPRCALNAVATAPGAPRAPPPHRVPDECPG